MTRAPALRHALSRAAANLVAVAAISAIFGLKALIVQNEHGAMAAEPAADPAYDSYFTAQP